MTVLWVLVGLAAFGFTLWWALNADFERNFRKHQDQPLYPESLFKVVVTESEIVADRPDATIERVAIADLRRLYIVTTSGGPWPRCPSSAPPG